MKKILLLITMVLAFGVTSVYALESKVTSISIKEKSSTIIVEEPTVTNNSIDAKITFKNVGDYVVFTLGLDIDPSVVTIESVTDNNDSEHIKTTYNVVDNKIEMKLEYKSALTTSMDLDNITITINVKGVDGTGDTIVINPATGDNIVKYITILGVSALTLSGLYLLRKKKAVIGVILLIAIIPTMVIAEEKMNVSVSMEVDNIKVGYDIVFNGGDGATGTTQTKLCYFGEACTLPENNFEKEGKVLAGWATVANGEVVYLDEGDVTNLASGGQYNLYAIWKNPVCRKVTNANDLHTATCNRSDSYGCNATGQAGNGNTITYGTLVNGSPKAGDAYDCDVNNDGTYDSATERFYYVESSGSNSILIYYKNMNDQTRYAYDSSKENWHGPRTGYQYLPSTSEWDNPGLIAPGTRSIVEENGNGSTSGGTIESFTYTDKAARFLTSQELVNACSSISSVGNYTTGELDGCIWLMENVGQYETSSGSYGYWLETPSSSSTFHVWYVDGNNRRVSSDYASTAFNYGVRPVITILPSDLG